ncbi:MAG: class II fructose-bisphosphate aldolase [Patescibacteria group bacterium]|nr:class II fructose-bisphosphate aldolase [Patescibacteria group bacterium]
MKANTIEILKDAMKGGYAVGAFNTFGLEITQSIVRASHKLGKPCIVQATTNAMKYAGGKVLGDIVRSVIAHESNSTQIGFHLDHGKTFNDVAKAIDAGADSVMIDASCSEFKENCEITSHVVKYAHGKGVAVQAELGSVPYLGREDQEIDWEQVMTDPDQAKALIDKTEVDALAIGIGNAHGFFRERPVPDWDRLKMIRSMIPDIPLILHGASDWTEEKVKRAIIEGVTCFNIDTDIRIAFVTSVRNALAQEYDIAVADPRKILGNARESAMNKIEEKIRMFNNR